MNYSVRATTADRDPRNFAVEAESYWDALYQAEERVRGYGWEVLQTAIFIEEDAA